MLFSVFQRSFLRRTTAETQMEIPNHGALPQAHPNGGISAPSLAAVSPHVTNSINFHWISLIQFVSIFYSSFDKFVAHIFSLGYNPLLKLLIFLFTYLVRLYLKKSLNDFYCLKIWCNKTWDMTGIKMFKICWE